MQYYKSTNFASSQCTLPLWNHFAHLTLTHYCTPTTCKIFHWPTLISQYDITCYIKINQYSTLGVTMIYCDIILHGNITKSHYEIIKLIASSQFPTMTWYALIWHHNATIWHDNACYYISAQCDITVLHYDITTVIYYGIQLSWYHYNITFWHYNASFTVFHSNFSVLNVASWCL